MGSNCCKEIRVESGNIQSISSKKNYISWIKGDKIGQGVYATVYKAIDTETSSIFAVKSISLKSKYQDRSKIISSIQKEVEILKTLDHNNIIKFYQTDIDIENHEIFIICEYAANRDLLSLIKEFHPLSIKTIQKFTKEVTRALEYIHMKGIIHRDLKCENILIDTESNVKLSDFGLSCLKENRKKNFAGSPYWTAPEVFAGKELTSAVDIWSLGCTVVEMITGTPPWSSLAKNVKELVKAISKPDAFPVIPKTGPVLLDFLKKCFESDAKCRPSASELLNHEFLQQGEVTCGSTI
jgi:serine/threonine protein kinase